MTKLKPLYSTLFISAGVILSSLMLPHSNANARSCGMTSPSLSCPKTAKKTATLKVASLGLINARGLMGDGDLEAYIDRQGAVLGLSLRNNRVEEGDLEQTAQRLTRTHGELAATPHVIRALRKANRRAQLQQLKALISSSIQPLVGPMAAKDKSVGLPSTAVVAAITGADGLLDMTTSTATLHGTPNFIRQSKAKPSTLKVAALRQRKTVLDSKLARTRPKGLRIRRSHVRRTLKTKKSRAAARKKRRSAPRRWMQVRGAKTRCFPGRLKRVLKKISAHYGRPIVVISGYRSPKHNRRIGGARRSQHMSCKAADFRVPGVSKRALARYTKSVVGRGGVGTYCRSSFIHVDVGPRRTWNWGCGRRKKSRRRVAKKRYYRKHSARRNGTRRKAVRKRGSRRRG